MLKENKGVTLVALVITIIVLLILAGVSISLVVGDNGVLSNATDAVDETNQAYAQQELEMAISSVQADFYAAYVDDTTLSFTDYCTAARLTEYIDTDNYTLTFDGVLDYETESTGNATVKYKGDTYSFTVAATKNDTGASCTYEGIVTSSSSDS